MQLNEFLREDLVNVALDAKDKWEAIEQLVDMLIASHEIRLTDRAEVLEAVFARERSLSTGLEYGVAVPHAAVSCVDEIIGAMAISKTGILFDSVDGQPAQLIILLLIPRDSFQRHVRTLAAIARLGSHHRLRDALLDAQSAGDVIALLLQGENETPDDALNPI
jgi:mannitol/fructose-specific phosphotransferase system IIA component (Ntr-type)